MLDRYGRTIDYMRISITDRCNLRCRYCMPEDIELVPMAAVLTYEEIVDICREAAQLGIRRLKITGGEPLVRRGAAGLIGALKTLPGIEQVTLTTNGVLLAQMLPELLEAGLDAVNVSLDTLDAARYREITGRDELAAVLEGLAAAEESGIRLKVNAVLERGVNDGEWYDLARLAETRRLDVRFIEMMPIGYGKDVQGVSNEELIRALCARDAAWAPDDSVHGNGPAVYLHHPDWLGSVGFISAIHGKLCGGCNRVRLTAKGRLKPCLCYGETVDLLPLLRSRDASNRSEAVREALSQAIYEKPLQHCFEDETMITETDGMSSIGG